MPTSLMSGSVSGNAFSETDLQADADGVFGNNTIAGYTTVTLNFPTALRAAIDAHGVQVERFTRDVGGFTYAALRPSRNWPAHLMAVTFLTASTGDVLVSAPRILDDNTSVITTLSGGLSYADGTASVTFTRSGTTLTDLSYYTTPRGGGASSDVTLIAASFFSADGVAAPLCFLAGTHLAVPGGGEVLVEELTDGVVLALADGRAAPLERVVTSEWNVDACPAKFQPTRIPAGTDVNGAVARRDLYLTKQHGVYTRGLRAVPVPSAHVEGWRMPRPTDVVLAEGVPCESYRPPHVAL